MAVNDPAGAVVSVASPVSRTMPATSPRMQAASRKSPGRAGLRVSDERVPCGGCRLSGALHGSPVLFLVGIPTTPGTYEVDWTLRDQDDNGGFNADTVTITSAPSGASIKLDGAAGGGSGSSRSGLAAATEALRAPATLDVSLSNGRCTTAPMPVASPSPVAGSTAPTCGGGVVPARRCSVASILQVEALRGHPPLYWRVAGRRHRTPFAAAPVSPN